MLHEAVDETRYLVSRIVYGGDWLIHGRYLDPLRTWLKYEAEYILILRSLRTWQHRQRLALQGILECYQQEYPQGEDPPSWVVEARAHTAELVETGSRWLGVLHKRGTSEHIADVDVYSDVAEWNKARKLVIEVCESSFLGDDALAALSDAVVYMDMLYAILINEVRVQMELADTCCEGIWYFDESPRYTTEPDSVVHAIMDVDRSWRKQHQWLFE